MDESVRSQLFEEYHQLRKRIDKLKAFLVGSKYDQLPEVDRKDLKEQLQHMEAHFKVLSCRVSRQCSNA
jgi:hypothetical protein